MDSISLLPKIRYAKKFPIDLKVNTFTKYWVTNVRKLGTADLIVTKLHIVLTSRAKKLVNRSRPVITSRDLLTKSRLVN